MLATEGPIARRTILQMFTAVGHEAREDEGPGSTEAHPYAPFLFTVSLPSVLHSRERAKWAEVSSVSLYFDGKLTDSIHARLVAYS